MSQAKYRQGTSASSDSRRDMIPRTGMGGGAVFVESASKFLQSYGKILAPVVVIVLVGRSPFARMVLASFWRRSSSL